MIQKFDRCDRRILTFPVVHPCEAVSPATLLESLITLSHNICSYQHKFFATQRRNAREMLRQIGILLIFFEEIRDHELSLSKSAVLCFSELHLAFQKILFLFEDCTREGARLCILMKSHYVSTQFHLLIRTIATALDVLPLSSIEVSCEIRELVELVAKQARKAKLEIDPDADSAMKRVILILNQFENKFEPDPSFIKRVLDYLEINNWSECHREIRILDEEISLECLDGSERELPLLSSLVGFMSYCRGVLFEAGPYGAFDQAVGVCDHKLLNSLNPEDFRCPISLELMTDPVTISTGQTYDRASIQKWLKAGNLLCPKTGEKLPNTELVPNSTLRKLIHQFCADSGVSLSKSRNTNRDITRTIVAGSPAAGGAIELLSDFLANRLYNGTREHKNKGAYEIRLLAKSNIFNRSCLIDAGTVPPLLNLLDSTDPTSQVNAISALLKLSKHDSGKKAIVENGGLKSILSVLKRGLNLEARQISAAIIFYLSSVHGYRKLIGATPGAIPALVELIKEGTSCGKKNAVVAIYALLLHHPNHQKVLEARTVPLLVDILASSHTDELFTDSLAVLSTLADTMEGSIAILQTPALPVIIRVLNSSATRVGKEYCARILLSLCNNCGDEVVSALAKDTSLMNLLYSLVTDGTSHASKKARLLIKILHNFQETRSSQLTTRAAVPQERFIHVT
ncbi:U-box domain-containing protein [Actinidia chinensis var. chinensis]|uniref:RING-type E3 ubiquitin transferase n=1 Tax=Actinidia chinensis var. chinensis TaxID=1590841 RepID=A0A2R6QGQ1_ACTCC|nr:U-box domain-containing protein [Actinidia chinensis var. chinensis]